MSNRGECLLTLQCLFQSSNLVTNCTLKLLLIILTPWIYNASATVHQIAKTTTWADFRFLIKIQQPPVRFGK